MTDIGSGAFKGIRVVETHKEMIKGSPTKIFPLLCPVQEYKWIDNWDCEIIFSNSDGVENNCIFKENKSGPILFGSNIPTYWTVSYYNPTNYCIQFVLLSEQIAITKIDVEIKDIGDGKSSVSWSIIITTICKNANHYIDKSMQNKAKMYLMVLGKALKHYSESGEKLNLNRINLIRMGFSIGVLDLIKNHLKGLSLKKH